MDGKRDLSEDVEDRVPQRLRDRVKAGLPNTEFPAVELTPVGSTSVHPPPSVGLESSFFPATPCPMGDAQ
ncbi:MAG TPA: hypothetical protein VI542_27160 [Candidatus Tectomicrobia bacterium]